MPLLPIVTAIGCEGRATTGSELASPSSGLPHEISGLALRVPPGVKRWKRDDVAGADTNVYRHHTSIIVDGGRGGEARDALPGALAWVEEAMAGMSIS